MLEDFGHGAPSYGNTSYAEHSKSQALSVQGLICVLCMTVSAGQWQFVVYVDLCRGLSGDTQFPQVFQSAVLLSKP